MRFGHFDDQNKEYVITTPQTPLPWINYLGSEDFFSLVSNTAGGYSFYRDARLRRLTRYRYNSSPLDMDGHHIYIKDGDTVWNPGWQPTKTELDSYTCRHGLGYTILEGRKNGVTAQQELFVPKGDACELDRLTLRNDSGTEKELDVFSYVEFCLWDAVDDSSNFQRNFSTGEVEVEGSAVYHKTEYRERRDHYAVFWANCPISSFDTSRDAFCGVYGGPADPQAVRAGHCSGSIAHGWAPVGALHIHVKLASGECRSILFGLGYIENPQEEKFVAPGVINKARAHAMMERYATDAQVDAARAALAAHWKDLLSTYQLRSGEEKLDRMVNIWHQYQCMVTFNMSRSASYYESGMGRGMGFRDSCQDLLGFVHIIPSRARERILDIAATQFEDGSAYHQYQPLTKKGNRDIGTGSNDDPLPCKGMAALGGSRHALINLSTQIDIPPIIKKSLSPATGYFGHKDEQSHHLNTFYVCVGAMWIWRTTPLMLPSSYLSRYRQKQKSLKKWHRRNPTAESYPLRSLPARSSSNSLPCRKYRKNRQQKTESLTMTMTLL